MKKKLILLLVLAVVCLGGCCQEAEYNTITQVSTIGAILAGAYDGQMTGDELVSYGDFGIGTFDKLDGEMVLLDSVIYQVKADGNVYRPGGELTTPFAAVVNFKKDKTVEFKAGADFEELKKILNEVAPNMNVFCAVKVHGSFARMKTRSVPAQQKPYPPLTEVTKNQPVFEMVNVSGTVVGFRSPVYAKGVGVPGYHLHFISDDKKAGGHILDFEIEQGVAEIDFCNRFLLIVPQEQSGFGSVNLSLDRGADLEKAER